MERRGRSEGARNLSDFVAYDESGSGGRVFVVGSLLAKQPNRTNGPCSSIAGKTFWLRPQPFQTFT
jgi:hypothetical protein